MQRARREAQPSDPGQRECEAKREAVRAAPVYLVTEESLSAGRTTEAIVDAALEAGVRVVQVREKGDHVRRALAIGEAVRRLTAAAGAMLIVNDRVDLALAIGAVGVSGDASDKDEYAAITGVHRAGLKSHPEQPAPNWSDAGL